MRSQREATLDRTKLMAQGLTRAQGRPDAGRGSWAGRTILMPVAVAALTALLRLPGLLEPHHYADEGIFAAVAQRLLQGHPLYTGAWDDKPPLVYWLYAAVMAVAGPSMAALRSTALLWAAAGAVGVTLVGRRLSGARTGAAAGVTFALLSSLPLIEGNLALTELFAATPVVWAMLLITRSVGGEKPRGRLMAAGALLAVAALFKQVAALDAAAAGLFLLLRGRAGRRELLWLATGFVLPVTVTALVLQAQRALGEGLYAVIGFYAVYFGEGSGMPPAFAVVRLLPALFALAAALAATRRRPLTGADLLVLWLGFACTGVALSARPYGHYLLQAVAPASLGLATAVRTAARRQMSLGLVAVAVSGGMALVGAMGGFWLSFPMVRPAYYSATLRYVTLRDSRPQFERFFSWRMPVLDEMAATIRGDEDRSLYVWGEYPWLYPLAEAQNPTRYVTSYHTSFVPGAKHEVLQALRERPPRYIVWERGEWRRLPGLDTLLTGRYELLMEIDGTQLYRRRSDPASP